MPGRKSTAPESDTDLIKLIRQEVQDATKNENLPDTGKGFVLWILRNYFDLDSETANLCLIDSPNDKRIDAFIEEDEVIKIIQCKFFSDTKKEVGGNEVALFKGCLDWLKKPEEVKKLNLPHVNPPVLEVRGFQVINGCQTTVCMSDANQRANWESIPEAVQIVVRFIKSPVKEIDLITLYTNSQNPVSEIQLKSNDPLQKRLKEELTKFLEKIFL